MDMGERAAASGKNLRTALVGQLLTVVLNFICRRIFIRLLGSEYMGLSGLCGHLLNLLSLLEPGFDGACAFALYRPLAYGDSVQASQICAFLRDVYRRISFLTLCAGLCLTPLAVTLSGDSIHSGRIVFIWVLSVADMSLSYLFSHRRVLPVSDQRAYVVTSNGYIFFIIGQAMRLFALAALGSFIAYFLAGIIAGILEELTLYIRVKRMYPLLSYRASPLAQHEKSVIYGQTRSLFFTKLGGIVTGSVDNMAVFAFLGLSAGAMYSNYTMLSGICLSFIGIMTSSVGASVGNLGAVSSGKRMERVFSVVFFAVFFVSGLLASALYFTYPIIVRLWLGREMVLGDAETALFCVSMLVSAIRRPFCVFIDGCGLFEKEKYKALVEAALGCVITLVFTPKMGICGVLTGQIASAAAFSLWYEPYILYKYGFGREMSRFLREVLCYIISLCLSFFLSGVLCNFSGDTGAGDIVVRILLCAAAFSSVFGILFFDSVNLKDALGYAARVFGTSKGKMSI